MPVDDSKSLPPRQIQYVRVIDVDMPFKDLVGLVFKLLFALLVVLVSLLIPVIGVWMVLIR